MSFDLQWILASKRALRRDLAARPVAEKLRMLDELRQRTLAIRRAAIQPNTASSILRKTPGQYPARGINKP